MKHIKNTVKVDTSNSREVDEGFITFSEPLAITDDSRQWNQTRYDINSLDITAYDGTVTADHGQSISDVIGKVTNLRKEGNKILIDGIKFAVKENPLAVLAKNLMKGGFVTGVSIETIGEDPDDTLTWKNHALCGLSVVAHPNNKNAYAVISNSIIEANSLGLKTEAILNAMDGGGIPEENALNACECEGECTCNEECDCDVTENGGKGSGNFGHAGRPGMVGGSAGKGSGKGNTGSKGGKSSGGSSKSSDGGKSGKGGKGGSDSKSELKARAEKAHDDAYELRKKAGELLKDGRGRQQKDAWKLSDKADKMYEEVVKKRDEYKKMFDETGSWDYGEAWKYMLAAAKDLEELAMYQSFTSKIDKISTTTNSILEKLG